jgi:Cdc6-like AAA superfamily ATPase
MAEATTLEIDEEFRVWMARHERLSETFTPSQPVRTQDIFSGRKDQLWECLSILNQAGSHGILHGDRGVGKTSIANIVNILASVKSFKVDCGTNDTFQMLFRRLLDQITLDVPAAQACGFFPREVGSEQVSLGTTLAAAEFKYTPAAVGELLKRLNTPYLFIFDEFDRLTKPKFSLDSFAELMKYISDNNVPVYFLVVGVGDSVEAIIGSHPSLVRNVIQIRLYAMADDEIAEIVKKGLARLDMEMSEDMIQDITDFSCGYPHYTHLLCFHACSKALHRQSLTILPQDLDSAIQTAMNRAHETLKRTFQKATATNRKSIYREVLQACGAAPLDEFGTFQPKDIEKPLSKILGREVKAPSFGAHLIKLCSHERGNILVSEGERGRRRYRFFDPLMRAFVKLSTASRDARR